MRLKLVVAALIGYLQLIQSIPLEVDGKHLEKDNDDCAQYPQNPGAQVLVETLLVYFPIEIKTFFNQNTILNINGGPTININNAPVYINTVVYGSVTSTVTSTISTLAIANSSVTATASVVSRRSSMKSDYTASPEIARVLSYPAGAIFTLSGFYLVPITIPTKKRQVNSDTRDGTSTTDANPNIYLGTDGCLTSCLAAPTFDLNNGCLSSLHSQLLTTSRQGVPVGNSIFGTSSNLGAHTTGYYILDSRLYWINPFFVGEEICFCILDNFIFVIFDGVPIPGCLPALLSVLPGPDNVCQTPYTTFAPSTTTTPAGVSTSNTGPVVTSASQILVTTIPLSSFSFVSGSNSPLPIASTSLPSATTATPSTSGNVSLLSSIDTLDVSSSIAVSQGLNPSSSPPSYSTSRFSTAGAMAGALTFPSTSASGSIISSLSSFTQSEESNLAGSTLTSSSLGTSNTFAGTSTGTYTSSAPSSTIAATDLALTAIDSSLLFDISSAAIGTTIGASSNENQATSASLSTLSSLISTADTSASATTNTESQTTSVSLSTLSSLISTVDISASAATSTESQTTLVTTADTSVSSNTSNSANATSSSLPTTTSTTSACASGQPEDGSPLIDDSNIENAEFSMGNLQECATNCQDAFACDYFAWVSDTSGSGLCETFTTIIDISGALNGTISSSGSGFFTAGCISLILSSSISPIDACEFGVISSGNPASTNSDNEIDGVADNLNACATKCEQTPIAPRHIRPVHAHAQSTQCLYFYYDDSTGQCDLYTTDISDQLEITTPTGGPGYYSYGCIDGLEASPRL